MNNISNKAKILIVDDVEANLIAFEQTLSDLDADIICVNSGVEALRMLTQHTFALVLLDVQMPEMDGFETAELMRKHKPTEDLPIIFVTAHNKEKIHLFKGYKLGAVDYLFKPVDPYILESKVKLFIDIYYQKTNKLYDVLNELESAKAKLEQNNRDLQRAATHDTLTQLPNRAQIIEEIDLLIQTAQNSKLLFAVIFLDIDNFKSINDIYGHLVGDKLLQMISFKLRTGIRENDILARISGDEFVIILPRIIKYEDAGNISKKIVSQFQQPTSIEGNLLHVTVSIGIACYPLAGNNPEELIKHADKAMYQVKNSGKNGYDYYSGTLSTTHKRIVSIEHELRNAIDNNELSLVYQPIYDLKDLSIYGIETYVRWNNATLGEVSPAEFISVAEDIGLIHNIGEWVVRNACQQFANWRNEGIQDIIYTINMSPKQFLQKGILKSIQKEILSLGFSVNEVQLELTESTLIERRSIRHEILSQLNDFGLIINIDDFGTGYSSLTLLQKLPINALKIDKKFINEMLSDDKSSVIMRATISLATSLNLNVIAECIETKEQMNHLIAHGCKYGQGYYLQRPVEADNLRSILMDRKRSGKHDSK